MASLQPQGTENIVQKRLNRRYRIPVQSHSHWQLRSLIGVGIQGSILYFPGGPGNNHVQQLNTRTYECETIRRLSFSPRCLAARHGWVCCGSEYGELAAFRMDEKPVQEVNAEPDLPLPGLHLPLPPFLEPPNHITDKAVLVKRSKFAADRVNCITLWFPPEPALLLGAYKGAYTGPVAVLANNDKSVVAVSLQEFENKEHGEALDVVKLPNSVNWAMISPDGQMLAALLDDPFLYLHIRTEIKEQDKSVPSRYRRTRYQWSSHGRVLLQNQRRKDKTRHRGSFAGCYSACGSYLAVGTQNGAINVFDTSLLRGQDPSCSPLVTHFDSSRVGLPAGAIRDMAFSPDCTDLLAWTEDQGRVGFADVRSRFAVRQILDLNPYEEYEHITVIDRNEADSPTIDHGRRHVDLQTDLSLDIADPVAAWDMVTRRARANGARFLVRPEVEAERRRRTDLLHRAQSEPRARPVNNTSNSNSSGDRSSNGNSNSNSNNINSNNVSNPTSNSISTNLNSGNPNGGRHNRRYLNHIIRNSTDTRNIADNNITTTTTTTNNANNNNNNNTNAPGGVTRHPHRASSASDSDADSDYFWRGFYGDALYFGQDDDLDEATDEDPDEDPEPDSDQQESEDETGMANEDLIERRLQRRREAWAGRSVAARPENTTTTEREREHEQRRTAFTARQQAMIDATATLVRASNMVNESRMPSELAQATASIRTAARASAEALMAARVRERERERLREVTRDRIRDRIRDREADRQRHRHRHRNREDAEDNNRDRPRRRDSSEAADAVDLLSGDGSLDWMMRDWESPVALLSIRDGATSPDNTTGLAWSLTGNMLYVGAENGIFEFHINEHARKLHPNLDFR